MNEIWKPIPGYEGIYEASNLGRVRCWLIRFGRKIKAKLDIPVILKTYSTWGYSIVELSDWTGKRKMRRLHRIILLTFVGPCPPDHEGCHLNGIRSDNRIENLAWATREENVLHKLIHGTQPRGEKQGSSKLTAEAVRRIRTASIIEDSTGVDLAAQYGVHPATISRVLRGEAWRHVKEGVQ